MKTKNIMYWVFIAPVLAGALIVVVVPFIWGIYYPYRMVGGHGTDTGVYRF